MNLKWDSRLSAIKAPQSQTDRVITVQKKQYYAHPFKQTNLETFKRGLGITAIVIATLLVVPIVILAATGMYSRTVKWIVELNEKASIYAKVSKVVQEKLPPVAKKPKVETPPLTLKEIETELQTNSTANKDPFPSIRGVSSFTNYVTTEYKNPQAKIRQNLETLISQAPVLKDALFINIRGDGDCAFRAMSVGLRLHTLLHPEVSIIQHIKKAMQALETTEPKYEKLKEALQKSAQELTTKLEASSSVVSGCFDASLDQEMIHFLRASSALYLLTQPNLPEAVQMALLTQSLEYGQDQEAYLQAKGLAQKPDNACLFGNIADMYAVTQLFGVPMTWSNVEEAYLRADSLSFPEQEKGLHPYVLVNVPGHVNLVLTG